jgi:Ras-related protein Rab-8A
MTVLSTVCPLSVFTFWSNLTFYTDIRTWHANIEQHASEGVNKILVGNKSDWTDKRAITEEEGRDLAQELGVKFMETSATINEGVEEAFFTLARCVKSPFS